MKDTDYLPRLHPPPPPSLLTEDAPPRPHLRHNNNNTTTSNTNTSRPTTTTTTINNNNTTISLLFPLISVLCGLLVVTQVASFYFLLSRLEGLKGDWTVRRRWKGVRSLCSRGSYCGSSPRDTATSIRVRRRASDVSYGRERGHGGRWRTRIERAEGTTPGRGTWRRTQLAAPHLLRQDTGELV
ncbi:hypothetical protein Pcinc_026131 [Petrolisthes cinctipes]|uniref:Uncharacterized protein n=1 Tax=Petrolisthes cinctipes TaxID=88211 RepID=A0AAE1KCS9_PETCI|nr:hypothetical protein Pcinc_026131 [Petrolisthes cinctipes]